MKQITNLNLNALKRRVVKVTKTQDALSDVTPFDLTSTTIENAINDTDMHGPFYSVSSLMKALNF